MRLTIFGLLLLLQTAPLKPKHIPESNQQTTRTKRDQQVTPNTVFNVYQGEPTQPQASKKTGDEKPEYKTWGFWVNVVLTLATLALVAVGGVGICAATRTLREMAKQRVLMQRQAEFAKNTATAALTSIDLMKSKERARISVPLSGLKSPREEGGFVSVEYQVLAICPTPAIIVESEVRAFIPSLIIDSNKFVGSMALDPIIHKTGDVPQETLVSIGHKPPDKIINPMAIGGYAEVKIVLVGHIRYRDIFQSESDVPHETKFRYKWSGPSTGIIPDMWFVDGGPEDNKQT